MITKDLGAVSAYAYAVEKGYTGTEAEYAELMASYATVAEQASQSAQTASEKAQQASASATSASQSADTASASAQTAQTAQQTASTKASEAQQSATTATTKAQEASQSASESSQSASTAVQAKQDAESAKTASETAQASAESSATTAQTAAQTATQKAAEAAESARTLTIDPTLSQSGQAADAKVVGDEIADLKENLNQIREVTDNILPYFRGTKTINGITFKGDGLGKFKITGTASASITSSNKFSDVITLEPGRYTFSCQNIGIETESVNAAVRLSNGSDKWIAANQKNVFSVSETVTAFLAFTIPSGSVKNGDFVYQLEKRNFQTDYIPHISAVDCVLRKQNKNMVDNIVHIDSLLLSGRINKHAGYLKSDGSFGGENTCYCKLTDKVAVISGETIKYKGYGYVNAVSALWYSDEVTIASSSIVDSRNGYTELTVPSGAKYAIFSSFSNVSYDDIVLEVFNSSDAIGVKQRIDFALNSNFLYGKKWVACGDSFTHGDFSGYTDSHGNTGTDSDAYDKNMAMYKTYPWWIAKRNGMILVNESVNGSTMAITKEHILDPDNVPIADRSPFSYQRYTNIPADADYITLWFGLNDMGHAYLGSITDSTNESFYGAWNIVLEYLITNRPYAKIGIIITDGAQQSTRNNNFQQAVRDVAEKWGIPYLDIPGDKNIPVMLQGRNPSLNLESDVVTLRNNAFQVTQSNPHPNLKAHEYQSTFIETWLRTL